MKRMKIIDLLNKIAKGEEVPKKIRITDIDDRITKHYNFFYDEDEREYKDDDLFPLGARLILDRVLNYEVEIIEENKKIEKIKYYDDSIAWVIDGAGQLSDIDKIAIDKINELIDKVKSLENK